MQVNGPVALRIIYKRLECRQRVFLFPFIMNTPQNNPWFAATIGLAGLIVGYVVANGMNGVPVGTPGANSAGTNSQPTIAQQPAPPPPTNETPPDVDDDPMLGDEDATITMIEFTDYQCPFCSRHFQQTYGQIVQNYVDTGKVKLVVRDFPLSFHPNAQKAAEATECADDQGKFWEMHDKLFISQDAWSGSADAPTVFKQYAKDLGLSSATFDSCLDSGKTAQEVQADMAAGSASGIDGTPGFWILGPNGEKQKISGAYPYSSFQTAFDAMLK
jgi:protein-disulfide isomerase